MSATEHLDEQLVDGLAPADAPSDDEVRGYMAALSDTDEDVREHAEKARPPFQVDDLGSADWAGRKIKQAQAKIDEAQRWRDRIVAEADAHLEREKARHTPTVEFFEQHLTSWLRAEIAADPKGPKSRELPCGLTVKRTAGRASLVVDDEAALIDWLKDHRPDLVESEVVWKWSKADVKKLADEKQRIAVVDEGSGEMSEAAGARIEVGDDRYTVVGGGA